MKHTENKFKSGRLSLSCRSWMSEGEPKAIILVVHGLAEHCGRYMNIVDRLVPEAYGVCGFDLRGHGKSGGIRGHVEKFEDYVSDLGLFHEKLKSEYPNTKIFLLGHSMGTIIALSYAMTHQEGFKGLILSAAMVKETRPHSAIEIIASRILSAVFPRAPVMRLEAETICRDESVVNAYKNDPLVYQGYISARLGAGLSDAMHRLQREVRTINIPVLLLHGTSDLIASPSGSEFICRTIGSEDKTLKLYSGCYHEVFNDFGHEEALDDLFNWLEAHV